MAPVQGAAVEAKAMAEREGTSGPVGELIDEAEYAAAMHSAVPPKAKHGPADFDPPDPTCKSSPPKRGADPYEDE